jgi:hypothetical protein
MKRQSQSQIQFHPTYLVFYKHATEHDLSGVTLLDNVDLRRTEVRQQDQYQGK